MRHMRQYIEEAINIINKLSERRYQRYLPFHAGMYQREVGRVWAKKNSLGYTIFMGDTPVKIPYLSFRDFVRLIYEHGASSWHIRSR